MTSQRLKKTILLFVFCLWEEILASSNYIPVTALDKYGNSIQLKHAREAALRHGRLIVAARCDASRETVVVSISSPKLGQVSPFREGVLERLLLGDESPLFLACTGIKADATWLQTTMQQYSKRLWERYDVDKLSVHRISQAVSETLLSFMGFDRSLEYHDGIGSVIPKTSNSDNDQSSSWARPLGVQTLVVTSNSLLLVEPSGIASANLSHVAIGKESEAIQRALREQYASKAATTQELKDLLISIIRETVQGQASAKLIVEVVSEDGVNASATPLRPNAK